MFNNVFVVVGKEFKRMSKCFLFWVGILLVSIGPIVINNPLQAGYLCTANSVAYYLMLTTIGTSIIAIPLLIGYIYFYDDKTEMNSVIFTQPINTKSYAVGKFLAVFFIYLLFIVIQIFFSLFIPLYFKSIPYSPIPFLKVVIIYVFPSIFYFMSLCYLILIISKSTIITTVVSIVWGFVQQQFFENTLFDFTLAGGKIAALASGEKLPSALTPFFIKNRMIFVLLGILFLLVSINIYSPEKNNIKRIKKSKPLLSFKINYNFRVQSKMMRIATIVIVLACIVLILISKRIELWSIIKMILSIIPLFLIVNVLSEEYVQNREGIIFICKTPVYKQMLIRIFYGWIFSELAIFICYVAAFFIGYENDFKRFFVMIILSTFLSLLGLTTSNLSKKPLLGFVVPIGYWGGFLLQGVKFNEHFTGVSLINLMLTSQIEWINLLILTILSMVLLFFNVWYIGKGEKIRKPLLKHTFQAMIIIFIVLGAYFYHQYTRDTIQFKVINSRDTIYVLDTKDVKVQKFLENKGMKYELKENFNTNDLIKNNIVIISDKNDSNIIGNNVEILNNIKLDSEGLQIKNTNIVDTSCFRIISQNPKNSEKYIIFMKSKNWTDNELNLLFNEKDGNFIAGKDNLCLFKSNYNLKDINFMDKNLKISYKGAWLMKKKQNVKIIYRQIPKGKVTVDDLLDIWYIAHKEINKIVKGNFETNSLQIYFKDNNINLSDNAFKIEIRDKRSFDPPKGDGDARWIQLISQSCIDNILFKNVKDEKMRSAWGYYLFNTKFVPTFGKELKKEILAYNYTSTDGDIEKFYGNYYKLLPKQVVEVKKEVSSDKSNIKVAGSNILYSFDDKKDSLSEVINKIYKLDKSIDNSNLEVMFNRTYGSNKTQSIFNFYYQVKEACDNYGGLSDALVPANSKINP